MKSLFLGIALFGTTAFGAAPNEARVEIQFANRWSCMETQKKLRELFDAMGDGIKIRTQDCPPESGTGAFTISGLTEKNSAKLRKALAQASADKRRCDDVRDPGNPKRYLPSDSTSGQGGRD